MIDIQNLKLCQKASQIRDFKISFSFLGMRTLLRPAVFAKVVSALSHLTSVHVFKIIW